MSLLPNDDDRNVALFIEQYFGPPSAVALQARSSFREDAAIREIRALLARPGAFCVLDVCCGLGNLPELLCRTYDEAELGRISYIGVDRETLYVHSLRGRSDILVQFRDYTILQREAWDLDHPAGVDLVVLTNALHELQPRNFPQMLERFNRLMNPEGHICIVDMEQLPDGAPESQAIMWSAKEIERILRAGGFVPEVTTHPKSVDVFQASVPRRPAPMREADLVAMSNSIVECLAHRLDSLSRADTFPSQPGPEEACRRIVRCGSVDRIVRELHAMGWSASDPQARDPRSWEASRSTSLSSRSRASR